MSAHAMFFQTRWRLRTVYTALLRQGYVSGIRDVWVMLYIVGLLLVLPLLQRTLSLPALMKFLDARALPKPPSSMKLSRLIALTRRLLQLDRGVFRPTCLKQSLVLFYVLRKWGHPVRMHFGITKHGDTLAGHCWLDLAGTLLVENVDPRQSYHTVYSFPRDDGT